MQTARKNVKNLLIAVACTALTVLAATTVILALPNRLGAEIIFFFSKFYIQIGTIVLGAFVAFAVYKFYSFMRRTKNPVQIIRANFRKNLVVLLSVPFIIYGCMALFASAFPTDYSRCDYYNEKLSGGVKDFQGKKFTINLCGTGGHDSTFRYEPDEIRLQVFNEKGDLVALRHFMVNWGESSESRGIHYYPDHIAYIDESLEHDFNKTVSIPPTSIDWIRARLPYFN